MTTPSFWDTQGKPEIFAIGLAIAIALVVLLSVRRKAGRWLIPAVAFLPVPVVALFSVQYDLVGWHGFMHSAPIYRIMNGGPVPPEDPLFAGGALRYPWFEQWVVAQLSRFTGANVHWLTLSAEVVAYAGLLAGGSWLASAISKDRGAIALAVLFTGFGISILHVGLFAEPLQRAFPGLWLESRVVPLDKFANITAMPIGYAAMALAAAAGVHLAVGAERPRRLAMIIAGCTLLNALVHPLSWLCLVFFEGIVGVVLLLARKREDYVRLAWLAGAVIVPCLLALPYLLSVGVSESSDGWSGLTRPADLWWAKAVDVVVYLGPVAFVAYLYRASLRRMLQDGNRALAIVLIAIPCMALAFLVARFPGRNEYKFLLCLVPPAAALLGLCLRPLMHRHEALAGAFIVLLLTPGALTLGRRPWFGVTQPCRTDGPYLRALDTADDELYQWIARETPEDAVFVTADMGIPPLGRRGLYIAVNAPWRGRNGWGLDSAKLLQWHLRRPDAVMALRQQLAASVLEPGWAEAPSKTIGLIQADLPGRPLFVHTRDPAATVKLDQTPGFTRGFRNSSGTVYAATAIAGAELTTSRELVAFNDSLEHQGALQPLIDESMRLINAKHPLQALKVLSRAAELYGDQAPVFNNLCVAHGLLGHRAEAVAACERAVALDPSQRLAINNLAWVSGLPAP